MSLPNAPRIDPARFAENARVLLDEDPRRYRNFGPYWWFVKALLKRHYDRHQMPLLGDYEDPMAMSRLPPGLGAADMLEASAETYAINAQMNLGKNRVVDADGEEFFLLDPDIDA